MTLPPVVRAAHVRRTPEEAFALFTGRLGAWWPLATHGVFGAGSAGLALEDGRIVEHALDGRTSTWGEVVAWEPPHLVAFTWHPGRDAGPGVASGSVEVRFVPVEDGTRVELTHAGWEAFGDRAAAVRRAYSGPNAWGYVLDHYADVADRVEPPGPALAELAAAYDAFFAEALAGGFGPPVDGEWTAEEVVAHVGVTDDAMAAVCRALVHTGEGGAGPRFENDVSNDPAVLGARVRACGGDLSRLVADGRSRSGQLLLLLSRLDEEQLARPVAALLRDHGEVRLDGEVAWERLALAVQARNHLPAHTEQLRALRPA